VRLWSLKISEICKNRESDSSTPFPACQRQGAADLKGTPLLPTPMRTRVGGFCIVCQYCEYCEYCEQADE
jgi:hypothetical protein